MSSQRKRVVITGMGVISPLGCNLDSLWSNLSAGRSGISRIENMDCTSLPFQSGGEVHEFTGAIDNYGPLEKKLQRSIKKNMKVMCREIEMGVAASQLALAHSALPEDRDPNRCGCLFGCDYILTHPDEYSDGLRNCRSKSSNNSFNVETWPSAGLPKVNPLWLLKYLPNMPNSHVSIYNDFRGPNNSITDRDASMNLAISEASSIIQRGAADVMLVGATGTRLHPLRTVHTVIRETVAPESDPADQMPRPFDKTANGLVLGEGAAALMLESFEHAQARSAKIWGEILGSGAAMVGPDQADDYLESAIQGATTRTLKSVAADLPANWHVHAQGLSTPKADQAESRALSRLLADHPQVPVTTAKSYTGYLGAASAAVELIASLLALQHGQLFPIRNLQRPIDTVQFKIAEKATHAGQAVLHSSFTMQGQASAVLVGLP